MWGLLGSLPFVGKYKRQLGAALTVGGVVARAMGQEEIGSELQNVGVAVLGVGVAHAEVKEKRRGTKP